MQTRIVLTPTNAKMLLKALEENISRFEEQHGEIELPPRPQSLADQLFGTVRAPEDEAPDDEAPESPEKPEE